MSIADLLARPQLSVLTRSADNELLKIQGIIEQPLLVDGRYELEQMLGRLLAAGAPPTPKTLDLIGHSTAGPSLLMLGDWVIDAASPTVTAYFRELAEQEVLPRLGIHAVRLLGCLTADTGHARWTICKLAEILGVEVYGTTDLIFSLHYDRGGFADERRYVLVGSADLRANGASTHALERGHPHPRVLDIDALPAEPLAITDHDWPHRIADREQARALLRLVRRRDGATMPGLLAKPHCEVALPAPEDGHYHRAQVLLDCELVRVYPDGADRPAVVYPVDDPHALKMIVDRLPLVRQSA
jgi:hypothetical protein